MQFRRQHGGEVSGLARISRSAAIGGLILSLLTAGCSSNALPSANKSMETSSPSELDQPMCKGIIDLASVMLTHAQATQLAEGSSSDVPEAILSTLTADHTKIPVGVLAEISPLDTPETDNFDVASQAAATIAVALDVDSHLEIVIDESQAPGEVEIFSGQSGEVPCPPGTPADSTVAV